jgi:hypothetical protein
LYPDFKMTPAAAAALAEHIAAFSLGGVHATRATPAKLKDPVRKKTLGAEAAEKKARHALRTLR